MRLPQVTHLPLKSSLFTRLFFNRSFFNNFYLAYLFVN